MKYLSLFSGIEAATVAWHPLGWTPVAFSEIDKTASKFLAETYPHAPNLGDVTKITEEMVKSLGKIDLIIFGSPCQDLSIAGKQRGLDGARSGLFRNSVGIIQWARQHCGLRFALWENVPGAYSSNKGRDFTEVVASLAGLEDLDTPENGWGKEGAAVGDNGLLEWACLDAQWFGLAARRKRVFALLDFGEWESRPPILLEPEGLRGDSEPSRKTRESVARCSEEGATKCNLIGSIGSSNGGGIPLPAVAFKRISHGEYIGSEIGSALIANTSADQSDLIVSRAYCIQATTIERSDTAGANGAGFSEELAFTLNTVDRHATAYSFDSLSSNSMKSSNPDSGCREVDLAKTLDTTTPCPSKNQGGIAILNPPIVRRLTPLECERLMGFPDNYTASMSNSQRYRTLGNSMAVPVIRHIAEKIMGALA